MAKLKLKNNVKKQYPQICMIQLRPYSVVFLNLILYMLFGFSIISAQEVVGPAGDSHGNANGSVSSAISEPVPETFTGKNKILTQGFHKANLVVTLIDELPGLDFEISAFPNPAADIVKLQISNESIAWLQYKLYDINGNLYLQNRLGSSETEIPFGDLHPAEYILIVTDQNKEYKSFKIVKTH